MPADACPLLARLERLRRAEAIEGAEVETFRKHGVI